MKEQEPTQTSRPARPLSAGHDSRCHVLPDKRSLVHLCGRCGAVEDAGDYYRTLVVLAQQLDMWGDCDIHEMAAAISDARGADEPTDDDYVEALVACVQKTAQDAGR